MNSPSTSTSSAAEAWKFLTQSKSKATRSSEIVLPFRSRANSHSLRAPPQENCSVSEPQQSLTQQGATEHERRHSASDRPLDARSAPTRPGVFGLPRHPAHVRQEFLLRFPRSAAPQARGPVRRLRFHAEVR